MVAMVTVAMVMVLTVGIHCRLWVLFRCEPPENEIEMLELITNYSSRHFSMDPDMEPIGTGGEKVA